jgi:hypothetical protein
MLTPRAQDWEFTSSAAAGGAATQAAEGGSSSSGAAAKQQIVLPALPAVDPAVAQQLAPPALVAGGVVLAGVALQTGARKLADGVSRGARIAVFGAAVLAAAAKILGVL